MSNDRSPSQTRRAHRPLLLLCLLLTALAHGLAPERAAAQEPRFLIETITIEGVTRHGAQSIIVSQSYLKTGHSYTERELQEAVYRVKRLPFVVGADLALRKGSERGSYELVISVEETRQLFVDLSLGSLYAARSRNQLDGDANRFRFSNGGTLGLREFVGANGLAFAAVSTGTGGEVQLQAGYTRYDLFGNNSYASFAYSNDRVHSFSTNDLSGLLGVPLAANLTLTLSPEWSDSTDDGGTRTHSLLGTLGLIYRTTDDPLIPTRGTDVEGALSYNRSHSTQDSAIFGHSRGDGNTTTLSWSATRYWPVTGRQSVGSTLQGYFLRETGSGSSSFGNVAFSDDLTQAELDLLYTASLWDGASTRRYGDLRFEANLGEAFYRSSYSDPGLAATFSNSHQLVASAGLVFRNQWGLARFNFSYYGREMF